VFYANDRCHTPHAEGEIMQGNEPPIPTPVPQPIPEPIPLDDDDDDDNLMGMTKRAAPPNATLPTQ
jgi:hypothetical protein